ncbi:hypothetical protein Gotur_032106 [Gossypium turneri]
MEEKLIIGGKLSLISLTRGSSTSEMSVLQSLSTCSMSRGTRRLQLFP